MKGQPTVARQIPRVSGWDNKLIIQRINQEKAAGSFGLGKVTLFLLFCSLLFFYTLLFVLLESFFCALLFSYLFGLLHVLVCTLTIHVTVCSFRLLYLFLFILLYGSVCSFPRSCLYFYMLLFVLLKLSVCYLFYHLLFYILLVVPFISMFVLFHVLVCNFTCYSLFITIVFYV